MKMTPNHAFERPENVLWAASGCRTAVSGGR